LKKIGGGGRNAKFKRKACRISGTSFFLWGDVERRAKKKGGAQRFGSVQEEESYSEKNQKKEQCGGGFRQAGEKDLAKCSYQLV